MIAAFVTGPANNGAQINRIIRVTDDVSKGGGGISDKPGSVLFPGFQATPRERMAATCAAEVVVLAPGWAGDVLARHDAQVAVWAGKRIMAYGTDRANGSGERFTLTELDHEHVQAVLDRGLQVTLEDGGE